MLKRILGKERRELVSCVVFGSQSHFNKALTSSLDAIITNRGNLRNRLTKGLRNKPKVFSKAEIDEIGAILEKYAHADKVTKQMHRKLLTKQFPVRA